MNIYSIFSFLRRWFDSINFPCARIEKCFGLMMPMKTFNKKFTTEITVFISKSKFSHNESQSLLKNEEKRHYNKRKHQHTIAIIYTNDCAKLDEWKDLGIDTKIQRKMLMMMPQTTKIINIPVVWLHLGSIVREYTNQQQHSHQPNEGFTLIYWTILTNSMEISCENVFISYFSHVISDIFMIFLYFSAQIRHLLQFWSPFNNTKKKIITT